MDVVSSYRAKAYCDHFAAFGIRPTLLTHRWEVADNQFVVHHSNERPVIEETESCKVIRLPYPGPRASASRLHTILSYINGDLDVELMGSYEVFNRFLWDHLKQHRYDVVLAIYNPHFHLKLAYEIWKEFQIPYVLDFRDLWENEIVTTSYNAGLKARAINTIIAIWWRRWIHRSLFFATVSHRWKHYLSGISGKAGIVVRNGFETLPDGVEIAMPAKTERFKIVHFGRMYRGQDLDIFLRGFKSFVTTVSPTDVTFEVIGLKKDEGADYERRIKDALGQYVTFLPYMSKDDLIRYCREQATLFFFPDFSDDNGSFAVKVYDYLMLGKNILVAPGGGEVSRLISELNAGVVANDAESVDAYLNQCYQEYKRNGYLTCMLNSEKLNEYSREKQVKVMADHIRKLATKH